MTSIRESAQPIQDIAGTGPRTIRTMSTLTNHKEQPT